MFNLGMGEITVVLLLALIFLGPSKLPELAAGLGKLIRELRKATSDVKNEIILDDSFRKPFEELRDAVTLHPDELKRRDQIRKTMEEAKKRLEEEEAARAAAAAAVMTPATEPVASLPPETPAEAAASETAAAIVTAPAAEGAEVAALVPPLAPPPGTVARNRPVEAPAADAPVVPAPPVSGPPRVVPPVSSLNSPRANVTQTLSDADLLAGTPAPTPRRPTPPPLPGVIRGAGSGKIGAPRPPAPAAGPNATQVLSESDLLHQGTGGQPGVKPPPTPGSKKT